MVRYFETIHNKCKIQIHQIQSTKIIQFGGFVGYFLQPLFKTVVPLAKYIFTYLAESLLIPLGLTATASAIDAGSYKKLFWLYH